jgi:DNA-binding transcriptional ArsR family regulator
MDSVRILRGDDEAKLVFDPMRREILRLLAKKMLTGAKLSSMLGLSAPTVSHHLTALKKGGLVEIVRSEAEDHGIIQKFYRATALVYVLDLTRMSPSVKRYFMPNRIERTRAMLAAMALGSGQRIKPSTQLVEKMTEELVPFLVRAAERRNAPADDVDTEELLFDIYVEGLSGLLRSRPGLFPKIPLANLENLGGKRAIEMAIPGTL